MDKTDRISFSFSFDLAGQNKLSKDPGHVSIAKTINIGRFLADLWSMLGGSGDHLGMIWACSGGLPGMFSQNRCLTRDSRIPDFSRKHFRKNRKNHLFGLPGPK